MKKSSKIAIGVAIGVLVLGGTAAVAGPIVYRDFIAAPAAEAPTLDADTPATTAAPESSTGSTLDPSDLVGNWAVADGSEAGYRVEEVLNGTDVTVTGRTSDVTGTFVIGDTGLTLESADLTVDVASIATDSTNRDDYFRDQAMNVSQNPTATFVLTEPFTLAEAPTSGDVVEATVTGDLTLAGKTQSVTATVQVRSDGTTAELAGSIPITFSDFGVTAPNLGFVSVEDTGSVEFQLQAARS